MLIINFSGRNLTDIDRAEIENELEYDRPTWVELPVEPQENHSFGNTVINKMDELWSNHKDEMHSFDGGPVEIAIIPPKHGGMAAAIATVLSRRFDCYPVVVTSRTEDENFSADLEIFT